MKKGKVIVGSGPVRVVPGYGGKYLMRQDKTLWRLGRGGEYEPCAVTDGRVRLYHLGEESRRSVEVLFRLVFPDELGWTRSEILEHDRGEGEGGGPSSSLEPLEDRRDPVGELLDEMLEDYSETSDIFAGKLFRG